MSIDFQFVRGPPQAQHSPRTVKYFTKTCVRGPRNIFNENIQKQEFGVSKTSTGPSEPILLKTELSLGPCVRRVPIYKRPAAGATQSEDREIFYENMSLEYR